MSLHQDIQASLLWCNLDNGVLLIFQTHLYIIQIITMMQHFLRVQLHMKVLEDNQEKGILGHT